MLYGRMAELMGRVELRREPLACDMGEGNTLLVRASQSLGQMEHNFVPTDQKIVINLFRFRCCAT